MIQSSARPPRARALLWIGAAAVTIVTGASQTYLGANWLTDVLGGWALGALSIAVIFTAESLITRPTARPPWPGGRTQSQGSQRSGPAAPRRGPRPVTLDSLGGTRVPASYRAPSSRDPDQGPTWTAHGQTRHVAGQRSKARCRGRLTREHRCATPSSAGPRTAQPPRLAPAREVNPDAEVSPAANDSALEAACGA